MNERSKGFTLVELVMVIVITGIIGSIVAVFLKTPVDQYTEVAKRAEMTDIADTVLRRIARDIRTAVPNSIRLPNPADSSYIEFLPTRTGGRYRANATGGTGSCAANGDELSFVGADSCFEIVGPAIVFAAGDHIVIGSTQIGGNPPYDSSAAGVLRAYTGATGSQIAVNITATQFPAFAQLPGQRFQIVPGGEKAVTYACENVGGTSNGTGTLKRYWNYGFNLSQNAPASLAGSSALLADYISDCKIAYDISNQRSGLVSIWLKITQDGESISLYKEIHVLNFP